MTQAIGACPQTPRRTEDVYEEVRFQNQPALFTSLRLKVGGIPKGLYRYEIRHEDGSPCQIARGILADHYGTLLTSDPIQLPADGYLTISPEDLTFSSGVRVTPEDFLHRHPSTGRDVMELFIAKPEEAPLFFSWDDGRDAAYGCIGHMRGDFEGNILHHTWWPHYWDARYNNAAFKADLTRVVDWLRVGFAPLKNLENMGAFCARYAHAAIPGQDRTYGFRIETKRYRYGKKVPLELQVRSYYSGGNLALLLVAWSGEYPEPWGDLTTNLGYSVEKDCAFVDVNDMGESILPWIEKNGLGTPTGRTQRSGFVTYPEYRFNAERLRALDDYGYQEYSNRYDREHGRLPDACKSDEIER